MKIAFDGQLLLEQTKTGIAWSAHYLVLELAKHPQNQCMIRCFADTGCKEQMQALRVYRDAGCVLECCRRLPFVWYKLIQLIIPVPYRLFFRSRPDIAQFFNFTVPPGVSGKRIVFIHDLAYKSCPHTVSAKTRLWLELSVKKSCRRAERIVTVSDFSKREIIRYLQIPKEKIAVVPNAVDQDRYHPCTQKQVCTVKKRLGICGEYFLYLGTIEPRKNLERLIGAYEMLCERIKNAPLLVLAGKKGWLCRGIYQKAERLRQQGKILFTGYIRQEDSPALMCGAQAFVFPSLYEGFGMPVLEAMACAAPVIVSNTSSLPEVVSDAGIMVNPYCERDIFQAMRRICQNKDFRNRLRQKSIARAKTYTWAQSAEKLMEVYRSLYVEEDEKKGM